MQVIEYMEKCILCLIFTDQFLDIVQNQHIRALEAEYGAKLFVKEGRRLALTGAGERFYRLANRLPALEAGDFSLTRPFAFVTLPDSPLARRESGLFDRGRTLCAGL